MMKLRTSLSNKSILIFLFLLFALGIVFGIIFFIKQPSLVKNSISLEMVNFSELIKTTKQNLFIYHIILIFVIFLLNFTVFGLVANIFYLFYEGCSFGFLIAIFIYKFKATSILFAILFYLLTKFIFTLIVIYICFIGIKMAKKIIASIILKKDEITYIFIKKHFVLLAIILIISILNDLLIYYFANKILNIFLFLL